MAATHVYIYVFLDAAPFCLLSFCRNMCLWRLGWRAVCDTCSSQVPLTTDQIPLRKGRAWTIAVRRGFVYILSSSSSELRPFFLSKKGNSVQNFGSRSPPSTSLWPKFFLLLCSLTHTKHLETSMCTGITYSAHKFYFLGMLELQSSQTEFPSSESESGKLLGPSPKPPHSSFA